LSNWKAFAAADACRKAMFSVRLAQAGMTGPLRVFEGSYGFFRVMGRKPVEPVQLGEPFGIRRAFMKRFPVGQFAQTVVEAALAVHSGIGNPDDISEINIHVSRSAIKIMADSPDKWTPQTHETADHSIPYAAALALMYGQIKADYYDDPYLHDARLLRLTGKVKCLPSEEAERLKLGTLCELELVLQSGERRRARVEYHRGHYKNPMSNAEIEEKLRLVAAPFMPRSAVEILFDRVWNLEKAPAAVSLVEATRVR
jgi:2-methylcitrate dehydratase